MKALLILCLIGIFPLLAEIVKAKKLLFTVTIVGLLLAIAAFVTEWGYGNTYFLMYKVDSFAICFSITLLSVAIGWFFMANDYIQQKSNVSDYYALSIFSLIGAVLLTSYSNFTMLFLGVEILSIPLYVLAASKKENLLSNEAGFKYFLMGAFASCFLLFGIALIYAATASFDIYEIGHYLSSISSTEISSLFYIGILFLIVGLGFKVSLFPFHTWAPDVYQGSPTIITAFMSTIVKTAVFAAIYRLFKVCFYSCGDVWVNIFIILSSATMLLGNITAVYQTNVKRLMAYSSIAHAGYMLMSVIGLNGLSSGSLLYYSIAYSVASICMFAIIGIISRHTNNVVKIDDFNGLLKKNKLMALSATIALLSLSGIPPLAGFFAKYYIFVAALQSGFSWLVIIAIIASLIGVYYYFKLIIAMFFKEEADTSTSIVLTWKDYLVLATSILVTIFIGLFPELIIKFI